MNKVFHALVIFCSLLISISCTKVITIDILQGTPDIVTLLIFLSITFTLYRLEDIRYADEEADSEELEYPEILDTQEEIDSLEIEELK